MTRTVFAYTDSEAFGGAEEALAILLTGLGESGWRPTLLHSGAPGLDPLLERIVPFGIASRVVPAMPEGLRGAARAVGLARILRAERPDVFHAHLTWPFGCKWALAAACVARVPAVVATAQLFVNVSVGPSRRAQVWALARRVNRIIAVSGHTRQRYHDALGWPLERLTVVPNAVNVERFAGPPRPGGAEVLEDGTGRPIALVPARLRGAEGARAISSRRRGGCRACGSSAPATGDCATSSSPTPIGWGWPTA